MHLTDLIAMRVLKEGFGSWNEIMEMRADEVLDAFHFVCFQADYQETYQELNKETK